MPFLYHLAKFILLGRRFGKFKMLSNLALIKFVDERYCQFQKNFTREQYEKRLNDKICEIFQISFTSVSRDVSGNE